MNDIIAEKISGDLQPDPRSGRVGNLPPAMMLCLDPVSIAGHLYRWDKRILFDDTGRV